MSKRVYELARELDMESKELVERINAMGIEVKSHSSVVSDIDAQAISNMILHSRAKTTETKIVKAPPKSSTVAKEQEVKIEVKAAPIPAKSVKDKAAAAQKAAQFSETAVERETIVITTGMGAVKLPPGKPLPKSQSKQMPIGVPLPKSESLQEKVRPEPETPVESRKDDDKKDIKPDKVIDTAVEEKPAEEPEAELAAKPKGLVIKKKASEIAAEKAAQKPAEKAAQKPAEKAVQKPAEKATEKPSVKTEPKKTRPTEKPAEKIAEKPSGRREKPSQKPAERSAEAAERPARDKKAAAPAKKDKDRKDKARDRRDDGDYREKGAKKGGKKAGLPPLVSMEKQAPKKYKKKAEKVVEAETSIDLETLEPGSKVINVPITVKGLSEQIDKSTSEIIMALMKLGIMANINQNLDGDTAVLLGDELGINIVIDKEEEHVAEEGLEIFEDDEADLLPRPPVITVMGHVDHGKTSLLDAIRKTNVTTRESGGITQHIGASEVTVNGQRIVFLDTPGHEAFTAMRARGAHVTDIAILVVAADDSVKPQTIESISHAKAAGVPIIVAINKIDKPEANPDRVKQDLANLPADQRVIVEDYGGSTISVPVSAKSGEGIHNLLEMVLLQAEMLELKANPNRLALGTVIEARLDKNKGPVATLLVENGTLETGMPVVVGNTCGRIRAMTNFKGEIIEKAGPTTAVEILGLNDVPEAGDEFNAVKDERIAREIAEQRRMKVREEVMTRKSSSSLEQLYSQIQEGEIKELNLIVKADVQGSVGALSASLEKMHNENVKVRIIHSGVGTVTENDIMLAATSDAIILGFNVSPPTAVINMAEREGVEIRTYRIIYDAIEDIEAAMKGMLDPVFKEVVLGKVEVRNTFKVPGVGIVAGAYVTEGKVTRNAGVRLVRDGIIIHEGKISSLKRFKDDVREVTQGYECGIGIENYNDIKEGDVIEAFVVEEIER